ncbi:MAG: biotin/lipoyl-containing protein, partial [Candidatus Dormibacteria bacterium]
MSDSVAVTLPAMGESVTEGTVARWVKAVGDTVREGETVVEVTTDKVDVEVPSPASGRLEEIVAAEGDTVEVGATLARIAAGATNGDGRSRSVMTPATDGAVKSEVAPVAPRPAPVLPARRVEEPPAPPAEVPPEPPVAADEGAGLTPTAT